MQHRLPLHSLIMLVGPAGAGKTEFAQKMFPDDEILSYGAIQKELTGDHRHQHLGSLVFGEFCHRADLKLKLGERVVADSNHLRKKERIRLAQIGAKYHVPVIYIVVNRPLEQKSKSEWCSWIPDLVMRQEQQFRDQLKEILTGDGMATVIDIRDQKNCQDTPAPIKTEFEIAKKINYYDFKNDIEIRGFDGIGIISDVHGMAKDFSRTINDARRRNLFPVQIGNLINYGEDSISTVDQMYQLITQGNGAMLIGDCETNLERWINQWRENNIRMDIDPGLEETIEQLKALPIWRQELFVNRFTAIMNHSRHHIVFSNGERTTMIVHAACSEKMWNNATNRFTGFEENRATLGEFDRKTFENRWNWIKEIPAGHDVYVGHNNLSTKKPIIKTNDQGGRAIFVDTGSTKVLNGFEGCISLTEILFK